MQRLTLEGMGTNSRPVNLDRAARSAPLRESTLLRPRGGGPSELRGLFAREHSIIDARRQSHLQASTSYSETQQTSANATSLYRQEFLMRCRRLSEVAKVGDVLEAQSVLQEMVSQGHGLSAEAYHGLIFSYMKAGDSTAALNALYAALDSSNLQPLPASFAVVIYSCAASGKFQAAETVYNLVASGANRRPSWVAYLKGLTSAGLLEADKEQQLWITGQVEDLLEEGSRQEWFPDLDLAEDVLGLLCEDPKKAVLAEELLDEMEQREGAETRHYNRILRARAIWSGVHNALPFLEDMIEGKTGGRGRVFPDIESYNALIEGCLVERMQGFSFATEDLESIVAETLTVGMQANKRTHALLLMFYMMDADLDRVLFELGEMERLAAPGRSTEQLSDVWLGRIFEYLLRQSCVLEVARLLFVMRRDDRPLPADVYILDADGRSFHTRWLPAFFAGQHSGRRNLTLDKYYDSGDESEDDEAVLVDDTYLSTSNVAIDETGEEMSVSDMSTSQMKAELEAKGLSTTGLKKDLSRRVQHSRGNQPIPVKQLMRRHEREVASAAAQDGQRQVKRQVLQSLKQVAEYSSSWSRGRRENVVDYVTYVIDPAKAERDREQEEMKSLAAADLSEEVKALLKERRAAFGQKDEEVEYMLDNLIFDTDSPEFQAVNPNFNGREGYGTRMTWPDFGRAARLSFYMLEMAERLGGGASFVDFVEIQAACIEENDPDTAYALLLKLQGHAAGVEPDALALFCNKTLLLCMEADRLDLATMVGEVMQELEVQPLGILGGEDTLPVLRDFGHGMQRLMRELRSRGAPEAAADPSEDEGGPEANAPAYDYDLDIDDQHEFYVGEDEMQALLDAGAELLIDEPGQAALNESQQQAELPEAEGGSEASEAEAAGNDAEQNDKLE